MSVSSIDVDTFARIHTKAIQPYLSAMANSIGKTNSPVCIACKVLRTANAGKICTACLDVIRPYKVPEHRKRKKRMRSMVRKAMMENQIN